MTDSMSFGKITQLTCVHVIRALKDSIFYNSGSKQLTPLVYLIV